MNLHTHNINNPLTLAPLAMSKLAASNVVSPAKQQTRRGVRQPSWRRYGGGGGGGGRRITARICTRMVHEMA